MSERKHLKEKFLLTHHNISITQTFCVCYLPFRILCQVCLAAFREIVSEVFSLHTLNFICYGSGLCLPANIFYFFFIKKLQLIILLTFLSGKSLKKKRQKLKKSKSIPTDLPAWLTCTHGWLALLHARASSHTPRSV